MTTTETRDLGLALLVAESEDGHYERVSGVATLREAREIAVHDFGSRTRRLHEAGEPLCPNLYKVWVRGADGQYMTALEILMDSL